MQLAALWSGSDVGRLLFVLSSLPQQESVCSGLCCHRRHFFLLPSSITIHQSPSSLVNFYLIIQINLNLWAKKAFNIQHFPVSASQLVLDVQYTCHIYMERKGTLFESPNIQIFCERSRRWEFSWTAVSILFSSPFTPICGWHFSLFYSKLPYSDTCMSSQKKSNIASPRDHSWFHPNIGKTNDGPADSICGSDVPSFSQEDKRSVLYLWLSDAYCGWRWCPLSLPTCGNLWECLPRLPTAHWVGLRQQELSRHKLHRPTTTGATKGRADVRDHGGRSRAFHRRAHPKIMKVKISNDFANFPLRFEKLCTASFLQEKTSISFAVT